VNAPITGLSGGSDFRGCGWLLAQVDIDATLEQRQRGSDAL